MLTCFSFDLSLLFWTIICERSELVYLERTSIFFDDARLCEELCIIIGTRFLDIWGAVTLPSEVLTLVSNSLRAVAAPCKLRSYFDKSNAILFLTTLLGDFMGFFTITLFASMLLPSSSFWRLTTKLAMLICWHYTISGLLASLMLCTRFLFSSISWSTYCYIAPPPDSSPFECIIVPLTI